MLPHTISLREQLKYSAIKVFEFAPPSTQSNLLVIFDKKVTDEFKSKSVAKFVKIVIAGLKNDLLEIRPNYLGKFFPRLILKFFGKSLDRVLQVK